MIVWSDGKYPLMDGAAKLFKAAPFHTPVFNTVREILDSSDANDHGRQALQELIARYLLCEFISEWIDNGLPKMPANALDTDLSTTDFMNFLVAENADPTLTHIAADIFEQLKVTAVDDGFGLDELYDYQGSLWPKIGELLETPNYLAWRKAGQFIEAAEQDPTVKANPETMQFLDKMGVMMARVGGTSTVQRLLEPFRKEARATLGRNAAQQKNEKNAEAQAWVLEQWQTRTDQGQGKRAFADQYRPLIKKKFDVDVGTEQIKREWLRVPKK